MAQSNALSTGDQEVAGSIRKFLSWRLKNSFVEIDYEVFYGHSLIQKGQLSVSSEGMCTSTGKRLRGLSLPRKRVVT